MGFDHSAICLWKIKFLFDDLPNQGCRNNSRSGAFSLMQMAENLRSALAAPAVGTKAGIPSISPLLTESHHRWAVTALFLCIEACYGDFNIRRAMSSSTEASNSWKSIDKDFTKKGFQSSLELFWNTAYFSSDSFSSIEHVGNPGWPLYLNLLKQ